MLRAVAREAALKHQEQQEAGAGTAVASDVSAEVGLNESYDALDEHTLPSLAALATAAATGLRPSRPLNEQSITALIQVGGPTTPWGWLLSGFSVSLHLTDCCRCGCCSGDRPWQAVYRLRGLQPALPRPAQRMLVSTIAS